MSNNAKPRSRASRLDPVILFTVGPLIVATLVSLLVRVWDVDLACASLWWHEPGRWFGERSAVCQVLNDFGPIPSAVVASVASLLAIASTFRVKWRRFALPAIYVSLAYLLGPGLLVNGVLKHSWGRARPKEVSTFGGNQRYEQVLINEPHSSGRSFPSGHASAAFYLSSLGFASAAWGRRRSMYSGLWLSLAWGVLMGWSRIASGAHFVSDVLWSAALVNAVNGGLLLAMSHWITRAAPEGRTTSMTLAT
jgi:membrane-associated PAP2 superfamily phosphatase